MPKEPNSVETYSYFPPLNGALSICYRFFFQSSVVFARPEPRVYEEAWTHAEKARCILINWESPGV